ncbi:MAG TPA: outer membrane beta-barrel protein [Candidatus Acidoferrales bacterium]|nr:outer membrane beta-barrel protein [Candidatus Acidoferrales bacterium]
MRASSTVRFVCAAVASACCLASGLAALAEPTGGPSPAPSSASPTPQPTPSPASTSLTLGPLTIDGVLSAFTMFTNGVNASGSLDTATGADLTNRTDISNAFLIVNKNSGTLRYGFAAGAYNIPVVGFALNKTTQTGANTSLYGALPSVYVEYAPTAAWNLMAGKLATFTGQEDTYTYENANIQRGIVWNIETAVSRGVRSNFTGSRFTGAIEVNDGYYSGNRLGFEGQITNAPNANTTFEFVWVIPNSSAPANATASIANKRLYNPLLTYTAGRWTFSPYLLFVDSPASSALGYTSEEHAFGAVFNASYAFNPTWSLPLRVEYGKSGSAVGDTSPNANLLGYGPGSSAWTYTLTPTYRRGIFFARTEASIVDVGSYAPGAAFGPQGDDANQFRVGAESGIQF